MVTENSKVLMLKCYKTGYWSTLLFNKGVCKFIDSVVNNIDKSLLCIVIDKFFQLLYNW